MNTIHCCWSLSLASLLFAASAQAAAIPITLSMQGFSELRRNTNVPQVTVAPDTLTLTTRKNNFPEPQLTYTELTLTDIEPDSIDRMLNYKHGDPPSAEWTITAANADEFGVNWLEFQNHLNESRPAEVQTSVRLFNPAPPFDNNPSAGSSDRIADFLRREGIQQPHTGELWATDFQLHEVKISLDYYFWHDILEGLRAVQIRAEIRGEARIIPEPASWLMLLLGSCHFLVRRR